jgi:hypothetical protein
MPFQDLRGGQLRSAPVSVDFNGQRWTFGQGLDGAIWMQIGEQTEWTCPRFDDIQDVEITSAAPAVAVLDHRIILVWRGSGGDRHFYYRLGTIDGRWGPRVRVTEQARTIDAPTVVVESRGLTASVHLVFRGEDEAIAHHEGEIDINRGGRGRNHPTADRMARPPAEGRPARIRQPARSCGRDGWRTAGGRPYRAGLACL